MPSIVPIPLPPNEDYDHAHSLQSSLHSLQCVLSSFDAAITTLETITTNHSNRLTSLTKRCDKVKKKLSKLKALGDEGKAVSLFSPSRLPKIKSLSSPNNKSNPLSECRNASNLAILKVLDDTFRNTDESTAKLSDEWLDRASGFEEQSLCRAAEDYNTVPSLMYNLKMEEARRTQIQLAAAGRRLAAAAPWNSTPGSNVAGVAAATAEEEDDLSSVITAETGLTTMKHEDVFIAAGASRRQADSGSLPFSCELLHDVYGAGGERPSGGDAGEFFPVVKSVGELRVFWDGANVYGSGGGSAEESKGVVGGDGCGVGGEFLESRSGGGRVWDLDKKADAERQTGDAGDSLLFRFSKPNVESYRPEEVSDDAGLFQLPEDLPLPDVASMRLEKIQSIAENDSIAPSRFVKKDDTFFI
eukprot:CAMPEP_0172517810 /NCGR_PEP_ID=MMETSP1066-20121228/288141_1 /TAXON_ID=671091 /ORGANISM="Coscinodiscus wailesii, Strain CCMP2513" /LENGTH=414 /DNA_ID=CAMNT_0013299989 /DNA_START=69 /DNA_END=1314 /DNA_ORIENTATION=-